MDAFQKIVRSPAYIEVFIKALNDAGIPVSGANDKERSIMAIMADLAERIQKLEKDAELTNRLNQRLPTDWEKSLG